MDAAVALVPAAPVAKVCMGTAGALQTQYEERQGCEWGAPWRGCLRTQAAPTFVGSRQNNLSGAKCLVWCVFALPECVRFEHRMLPPQCGACPLFVTQEVFWCPALSMLVPQTTSL